MVNLKGSENAFCVQAALPEKSVRTINFGSAAGCEAGLCPAVAVTKQEGAMPPVRALPAFSKGQRPNGGHKPLIPEIADGAAQPRLVSHIGRQSRFK